MIPHGILSYTHRSVPYSVILGEVSSCSREDQMQTPTGRHSSELRELHLRGDKE